MDSSQAEVGLPDVRSHEFRPLTLVTLSGATTREQMRRLGHASPAAAIRYRNVLEGRGRAVADGIDRILGTPGDLSSLRVELRIDRAEVACRAHKDAVCPHRQKGGSALRLVWNDDHKLAASRLCLPGESNCRFPVPAWRAENQMEILTRVGVVDQLFEVGDAVTKDCVPHNDELTPERCLVVTDRGLAVVPPSVLSVEERALPR